MKLYNIAFLLLLLSAFASPVISPQRKATVANLVFKSGDGGTSWQDISEGLPENWNGDVFFANDRGLYVSAGDQIYYNTPTATATTWQKEIFPEGHNRIAPGKNGILAYKIYAYNWDGQFLQKVNGTNDWSPMFTNFQVSDIRTVHETAKGTLFVGTDYRLYKSIDRGKSWQQVYLGGSVMKLAESNGILMATSQKGIMRSADGGDTWEYVISEGGVGIDIESIEGGFVAINYNAKLKVRTVKASYDGGTTWQTLDAGLPAAFLTSSIIELEGKLYCGHPAGIYSSADKGKTWKLLLPSIENKVFTLFVSGNVIYAIPRPGGC